jgi:hypothetical protein
MNFAAFPSWRSYPNIVDNTEDAADYGAKIAQLAWMGFESVQFIMHYPCSSIERLIINPPAV